MYAELEKITAVVCKRLQRYELKGRTITLKIKYSDFKQITRSRSLPQPVYDEETVLMVANELLLSSEPENKKIRLLGISLSNFNEPPNHVGGRDNGQLSLFPAE